MRRLILPILFLGLLLASTFTPALDLAVSGFFYLPGYGFIARNWLVSVGLTEAAFWLPRLMLPAFLLALAYTAVRRARLAGLDAKAWLFLLLGLLLGPGLVANIVLKDHWGRARPLQTENFGGAAPYTPPLVMTDACAKNCSFVSGDASFGFYLPIVAFLVADPRRARRLFRLGLGCGFAFGLNRIAMGAHYASDVLYAALFMLLVIGLLHRACYGAAAARAVWRNLSAI